MPSFLKTMKQVTAYFTAMNSCQIPLIKKEVIAHRTGATIHRGRGGSVTRCSRGRTCIPCSRRRDSVSGVCSHVQAGLFNFSIISNTELNWNPVVETMKSLDFESQLIVLCDFQNESVRRPLQETEVYSQETIRLEHRKRSGIGLGCGTRKQCRTAIDRRRRSNSNRSSGGVRSHMQQGSVHFSNL